jgi:RNA polymerase sigma-70 factor (ECF subfamily)
VKNDDSDASDLKDISHVLRGETDSYRDLMERHYSYIYRLSLSFLGNPEDAEDAVQEIFLRAFRALGSFKLCRRFKPWLISVALNYLRTASGKKYRYREIERKAAGTPRVEENGPEEVFNEKKIRDTIQEAVSALPHNLRTVVTLYYLNSLSVGEVSETLNLSVENVKSRLYRARKRLRAVLEKDATVEPNT